MNARSWMLFACLVLSPVLAHSQVTLQVEGDEGLRGRPISLDGEFVGVVGDTVTLVGKAHRLGVEVSPGILGVQQLIVDNGAIRTAAVALSECTGTTEWSLQNWTAASVEQRGPVTVVHLTKPNARMVGPCVVELPNVTCYFTWSDVEVVSVPEVNAEIWLDGRLAGAKTASRFRLQHCEGVVRTIDVILRKPGYMNCAARIVLGSLGHDGRVSCEMRKL